MRTWKSTISIVTEPAITISGETLEDAIRNNFKHIVNRSRIGNAAGSRIITATVAYEDARDVPGVKGYARLALTWVGLDLAHQKASPMQQTTVISFYAEPDDLPTAKTLIPQEAP